MSSTKVSKRDISKPRARDLFESSASKSQIQQLRIIEAALESFSKHGIEKTTYTNLAKRCKISRPLIHHYFPTLEDLFLLAAKYVRKTLLNLALEEMTKAKPDSRSQIEAYARGCIRWVKEFPEQNSFWLLYFYQCSLKGLAREENTKLVQAGHERIRMLIEMGNKEKTWAVSKPVEVAKTVQLLITGTLVSLMSEDAYLTAGRAESLLLNGFNSLLLQK
ncbi:MAG TPA: TetR/AcrR family transcriptional regulator [Bdellovibrionales bacterium]|jgi:AcrR family transcriptional regulator|nr:TetR/AcrR family transcriptional regulator [Bdellovibrionales bacterium]